MTDDELPAVPDDFVAIGPPIASGGSAVVWRARHCVTGREVALKVWHHPLGTAEQRAQFDAESRLHQQLSGHPHIVPWLWAAAPADAPAWMATELYGQALSELTAETGPLDDPPCRTRRAPNGWCGMSSVRWAAEPASCVSHASSAIVSFS